jgi:hypothetical protein
MTANVMKVYGCIHSDDEREEWEECLGVDVEGRMDTPVYLHDISSHDTLSPDTGPDTSLPDPYDTTGLEYFFLEMFWIQYVQAEMSELGVDMSLIYIYNRYRVVNSRKNRRF